MCLGSLLFCLVLSRVTHEKQNDNNNQEKIAFLWKVMKIMNKAFVFSLLFLSLLVHSHVYGQEAVRHTLAGTLTEKETNRPIADGYVGLLANDSLVGFDTTDKEGRFEIEGIPYGKYAVSVTALFFKDIADSVSLGSDTPPLTYVMEREEKNVTLEDVTVMGDRSKTVERMANGQRFFLSIQAKKQHNPFVALREIPMLLSDPSSSSVTMLDGKRPLILINGNRVNSGIAPINPSDIECVEVINNVSARYLQEGIGGIVNIKVKRKSSPYVWLEAATRHDLPIDKGFGVFYFEVGNSKVSLYGRTAYNYTHHDDTEGTVGRGNTTYSQSFAQTSRNNAGSWLGELLLKWSATPRDYFAVHGYANTEDSKNYGDGTGTYTMEAPMDYSFSSFSRDKSWVATGSMYYKHSFAKDNDLEVRLAYNLNRDDYDTRRDEVYGEDMTQSSASLFKNKRQSGVLMIDYAREDSLGRSLGLGSHTTVKHDDIDERTEAMMPAFTHDEIGEYLYGSLGGKAGSVYYLLSVGVEGIWLKAGNASNHYFRPRGSAAATWTINRHNSLRLNYTLTNDAPEVSRLNPYNISTDSLVIERGNPALMPQTMHYVELSYTLNKGNLYLTPNVYYKAITDMIDQYGYSENGIYTSTYANMGHFSQTMAGMNASYRFPWGRVYVGGGWYANYYLHQQALHMAFASAGFNATFGKFSFYGDVDYNSRDVTATSRTHYYRPSMAQVQVNYNFTPDFYIALCLQHFTGEMRTKTVTTDGTYHAEVYTKYKDRCLRPWILVRYTFRKNSDKKIKLGKVLDSYERGISIQR